MFIAKRRALIAVSLILLILVATWPPVTLAQSNDAAATQTLGLLNQWRMQQGLWPLRVNPVLQQAALDQAAFVLPKLDSITDYSGYHTDAQGRGPLRRLVDGYQWPTYGKREQAEIGENAADFPPIRAVAFWQSSQIHTKAALSGAYREVGIVALKSRFSFFIVAVFGGRPNVLPALVSPDGGTLYLSHDRSRYNKWASSNPSVRFYDANREPLTDAMPWKAAMPMPSGVSGTFWVRYSIVRQLDAWTLVNPAEDLAIVPGSRMTVSEQGASDPFLRPTPTEAAVAIIATTSAPPSATLTVPPTTRPTLVPTRPRAGLVTNTPRVASAATLTATVMLTATPVPTNTPTNTLALSPTWTPTATTQAVVSVATATRPPASTGNADLIIFYTPRSLTVFNASRGPLNLTSLQVGRIPMATWQRVASFPAEAFPAAHCLQADLQGFSDPARRECRFVRSQIIVSPTRIFWAQGTFEVRYNNAVAQLCYAEAGRCEVDLP